MSKIVTKTNKIHKEKLIKHTYANTKHLKNLVKYNINVFDRYK